MAFMIQKALEKMESALFLYGGYRKMKAYDKKDFLSKSKSIIGPKTFFVSSVIQEYNPKHLIFHAHEGITTFIAEPKSGQGDTVSYIDRTGARSICSLDRNGRSHINRYELVDENKKIIREDIVYPMIDDFRKNVESMFPDSKIYTKVKEVAATPIKPAASMYWRSRHRHWF